MVGNLVPRRSLLPRCQHEVWVRAGECLSVTSQLTVKSRIDRAENALELGWQTQYLLKVTEMLMQFLVHDLLLG